MTSYRYHVNRFYALQKLKRFDCTKFTKIWHVKFFLFNFKRAYLAQFSTDVSNLDSKSKLGYALSKTKVIMKIKQKPFVLLLINQRTFLGTRYSHQSYSVSSYNNSKVAVYEGAIALVTQNHDPA